MDTVTIYGRPSCGFCVRAIDLCESRGFPFRFIDIIEEGISKADLAEIVGRPVFTVPQILVGQAYIGGYDEFSRYVSQLGAASAT